MVNQAVEEFHFSMDGRVPIAKTKGFSLRGFGNVARDKRLAIKTQFEKRSKNIEYFRLMSDIVTRYYFPHLVTDCLSDDIWQSYCRSKLYGRFSWAT